MIVMLIRGVLFIVLLLIAAVWDMKKREIPDLIPLALLAVGCIGITLHVLPDALFGLILTALPYFLTAVLEKCDSGFAIGGGDIKLMAGCGFIMGVWGGILQSTVSLIFVLLYGAFAAKIRKQKFKEMKIPLAPFFCVGGILAYMAVLAVSI